jgi:chaperonin GroEL
MHFDNGYLSPYMVTDTTRMETVFEDPYILLTNKPIKHVQDIMPLLDQVMKAPRPIVILAENVEASALGMLVTNTSRGTLQAVAVRARASGTGAWRTCRTSRPSRAARSSPRTPA